MRLNRNYDDSNPISIEKYAQNLIGKTFGEVCKEADGKQTMKIREEIDYYNNQAEKKRKGGLGEIIEERFFYYKANNDASQDFKKAGVELKVTPYKKNKNGSLSAKERLIITMIDYFSVVDENFENSHFWNKARLLLLIFYLYSPIEDSRLNYKIKYVKLFSPPIKDLKIIKDDFGKIVNKIRDGKAHELSEADTLYLGAAPKAATSKNRRKQPFSNELAKPRAFSLKNSYMTYVLNNYIVSGKDTYESIVKNDILESFEDYVSSKIEKYQNYSVEELCSIFSIEFERKPKNLEAMIAYRILGISGNHAEEFEKANIVVKIIRIGNNNKIKESMSFPTFKFKELIKENWETADFNKFLSETRFLFVVYKFDKSNILRLKGCQFWNMPYSDINNEVKKVWARTKKVLNEGLKINVINDKNHNNFPKASENRVCHVRPHARNAKDTYELPDGRHYPKQCFWLNSSYIRSQLDKRFYLNN